MSAKLIIFELTMRHLLRSSMSFKWRMNKTMEMVIRRQGRTDKLSHLRLLSWTRKSSSNKRRKKRLMSFARKLILSMIKSLGGAQKSFKKLINSSGKISLRMSIKSPWLSCLKKSRKLSASNLSKS